MRLPYYLTASHIRQAIQKIDRLGKGAIPIRRRSTKFVLRDDGRDYPPKWVICLSHEFVNGKLWPNIFGGGPEANNFLIARGFQVWNKRTGKRVGIEAETEAEESMFPEGRASYQRHRRLERDSRISRSAKNRRLREVGDLTCDGCGFSFRKTYGEIGVGYIEAHHTVPVSELKGRRRTKLSEIALVCSNCHRMLHRSRPWLSIAQLKTRLGSTPDSP